MTIYTIRQLEEAEDFNDKIVQFFLEEGPKINKMFGTNYDFINGCSLLNFAKNRIFLICERDNEVRGYMIAGLFTSPFDYKIKILQQISFYVKPDSGRTAYHLFNKFIDIGKDNAHHIITMLTSQTNIKPSTLKKLGFNELETLYRMETNYGTK